VEQFLIRSTRYLGPLALLALAIAAHAIYNAPRELVQGLAQKIFYIHVPCVTPAYTGFLIAAIGGIGFLRTGREVWDRVALAGAEVGIVFCTLMIISGPIWARPIWGVWWDWGDLRLTSTAILWFIYLGYLFLRSFADGDFMRRTAAIVAVAGTLAIPFVFFAVELAGNQTVHPGRPSMSPEIKSAFLTCMVAFLFPFMYLFCLRLSVARAESEAEEQLIEALETRQEFA